MHYHSRSVSSSLSSPSLSGECKKAEKILDSFINPEVVTIDKRIPRNVLENAKGLAIFTVFELGMMRSLRFGSGLVVARLPNGTWSAPSAITTGKLMSKGQFGMELTDYVYVLNSTAAVEKFASAKPFTLGTDVSVAVGPFGRSAELAGEDYGADAEIFAYCKTKSVFGGATLEGTSFSEREDVNRRIYGWDVEPRSLLNGDVALPAGTYEFMKLLHSTLLRPVERFEGGNTRAVKRARQSSSPVASVTEPSPTSSTTPSLDLTAIKEETRFYGPTITAPHQITIQVTDWSDVELPPSLTRSSMETLSEGSLTRHPSVLNPGRGRRSWSGSSSGSGWSRHDPLDF